MFCIFYTGMIFELFKSIKTRLVISELPILLVRVLSVSKVFHAFAEVWSPQVSIILVFCFSGGIEKDCCHEMG